MDKGDCGGVGDNGRNFEKSSGNFITAEERNI